MVEAVDIEGDPVGRNEGTRTVNEDGRVICCLRLQTDTDLAQLIALDEPEGLQSLNILVLPRQGSNAMITTRHVHVSKVWGIPQFWLVWAALWLNVSAGIGTSPYAPVRFCCRPEATLLTLIASPTGGRDAQHDRSRSQPTYSVG